MTNLDQIRALENESGMTWKTFKQWKDDGYSIKAGAKGYEIEGWGCKRDYSKSKRGRKYFYRKKIYVFSEEDILNYKKDTNCEEFHELDLLLD